MRAMTVFVLAASFFATAPAMAKCSDAPGPGMDWSGCKKDRLILKGEDMSGARFEGSDLSATDMMQAHLLKVMLKHAELSRARFTKADLSGGDLSRAYGSHVNFNAANLSGVILEKAELSRSNFSEANLSGAMLDKAELGRGDFRNANLENAVLTKTVLARSDFSGATLKGADMAGAFTLLARVEGVDLSEVKGLTQDQLDDMCGDQQTVLPASLVRPATWPCPRDE